MPPSGSSILAKKLYVGNLTYNVNESDLEALFSQFGTVQSAQIIVDRDTNRSKGFGFVEMDTDAQAQAAIQGLHEKEHDGRRLTVNEAKPREPRSGGGGYGGGGRSGGGGYGGGRSGGGGYGGGNRY
jgi:cold-inducible RNA-binding protein